MTHIAQKATEKQPHQRLVSQPRKELPSQPNQQERKQSSSSGSEQEHQKTQPTDNNILPLTHKTKKKRHNKRPRKHSPEYYEELKIKKINKKLEQNWDNRFANDGIPSALDQKKNKRRTLSKIVVPKRAATALQNQIIASKTVQLPDKKQGNLLPKLQKKPVQRTKSFNVHVINTAKQEHRQSRPNNKMQTQKIRLIKNEPSSVHREYAQKITQVFDQSKFLNCHKQILQRFLTVMSKNSIRLMLDKELSNIKQKKSLINKIMTAISNRQKFIEQIKQTKFKKADSEKEVLQLIDNYRTSTLVVIEEILKWKQNWNQIYLQVFNKNQRLDLVYKSENYLITIMKSMEDILASYHKDNNGVKGSENLQPPLVSRDPFLISLFSLQKQDKNIILKIRACELLLLQQEYLQKRSK